MKITDNIFVVPEVGGHVYLILDRDELTLIDTGLPGSHRKILDYIANLGKHPTDLTRILITHADLDHVGSLAAMSKASGAHTYTSQIEADALAAGKPSRPIKRQGFSVRRLLMTALRPFLHTGAFRVDEIVTDGQVLPIAGGLRVVSTIGHTPGHISFFAPAGGVLFCGDSMVTDQQGIHGSRPAFTWDAGLAQAAVRKQAALHPRIVCSGHGPVVFDADGKLPV